MTYNIGGEGTLDQALFTEAELIDRYVGGRLWVWGRNNFGQLGDNTIASKSSPVQTVAGGTNWKQVVSGDDFVLSIKTDGTLWSCGANTYGSLGDNTTAHKSSPVQTVAGGTNWKQLDCGMLHVGAIKTDGTLWMWGGNAADLVGALGDNTTATRSSPVQTVAGGTNWKQVACGLHTSGAVKTDGTLWMWGYNAQGGLGDNTVVPKSSPVQTVAGGTNWKALSIGGRCSSSNFTHTAAIKTDGTLWCWGYNTDGNLGDNTTAHKSSPVQTVAGGANWGKVSAGPGCTAAIKTDGTLWLWGRNDKGNLGNNAITSKSSPVQTVTGGTNWKQVTLSGNPVSVSSEYPIMMAVKTDGTLWSCGVNTHGSLGDNTITHKSSPVQTVAGGASWKTYIALGNNHACAITFTDQQ